MDWVDRKQVDHNGSTMNELETRHAIDGELEIRQDGLILTGRFPYEKLATINDRLTTRKETFSAGAFRFSIEEAKARRARIDVLQGHSFDRPLGNTLDGQVTFEEIRNETGGLDAVFHVELPVEGDRPLYMQDMLTALRAGLMRGVSPGFRVAPKSIVRNAEILEPERGNPAVKIRRINQAVLYEMSIVTRAQYPDTSVENRMAEMGLQTARRKRIWL